MKILHAHPAVPAFVTETTKAYQEQECLAAFHTTFVAHPEYWLSRLMERIPGLAREVSRRACPGVPISKLRTFPYRELARILAARYASPVIADLIWENAELAFDEWVSRMITRSEINGVHVYEHAGLACLRKAKMLGIAGIYEQPSQHHTFFTTIAEEQFRKYPELKTPANSLLIDEKSKRRNRRRDEELALASLVICNSSFTKRTLISAGISSGKISVVPYAFPEPITSLPEKSPSRPLVFLSAGTQNLRKAAHLLYRAWRQCNFSAEEAELWIIGKMTLPPSLLQDMPGKVTIRNNISRNELLDVYSQAEMFVLPTLADGFGMVISEAMSRGLTVITTENSGGPDIIDEGSSGFFVRAGDVDSLAERLRWCVAHRDEVRSAGHEAWMRSKTYQWKDYRAKLLQTIREHVESGHHGK